MSFKRLGPAILIVATLSTLLGPGTARADSITFTLDAPSQSGLRGTTLTFFGLLSAPSTNANPVFVNGDIFATSSLFLTVDDTGFLLGAPVLLAPGASSGSFDMFSVTILAGTPTGTYPGNFFNVEGGPDGVTFNLLAGQEFIVTVTPEPGTMALLATGLAGLCVGFWIGVRRKRLLVQGPPMAVKPLRD